MRGALNTVIVTILRFILMLFISRTKSSNILQNTRCNFMRRVKANTQSISEIINFKFFLERVWKMCSRRHGVAWHTNIRRTRPRANQHNSGTRARTTDGQPHVWTNRGQFMPTHPVPPWPSERGDLLVESGTALVHQLWCYLMISIKHWCFELKPEGTQWWAVIDELGILAH